MRRSKRRVALAYANRREFFKRAGGAALAFTSVALLPACGGGGSYDGPPIPTPAGSGLFRHGVASGDPLSDRVILWTRVTPSTAGAVDVTCVVATDTALANIVANLQLSTDATRDYTVKVDVTGLQPATTYYYRFATGGTSSPIGRTRTLPVGATSRLRLAVVSCSSIADGFFNAYGRVAERADLDLVVHLGDYIYEYGAEGGDVRVVEPAVETVTLADYRTRHAQHKRDTDLQAMHRQHPMIAIWDDHDIASNANATGSQNHTEGVEGTWANRVNAALQAFYEWLPVRVVDVAQPRVNYRSFVIGDLAELVMLEERVVARSPQLPGNATLTDTFRQRDEFLDPSREMLGSIEQDWLATRLRSSPAKWKLLGNGVMFAQLKLQAQTNAEGGGLYVNADQWDGYQPARDRVYDIIKGDATHPPVRNIVVLSGDAHSSWAADLTQDPSNGQVYDPSTGNGSLAVEFVGTSVTSPMILNTGGLAESLLRSFNPHIKYVNLSRRGYMVIDVDPTRVVGEWWFVDDVTSPSTGQSFANAYLVLDGEQRMIQASQTITPTNPPPLAPG